MIAHRSDRPADLHVPMPELSRSLLHRCLSVDLEVDPRTAQIFALAAVWNNARPALLSQGRDLVPTLDRLGNASANVDHLIGHNIFATTCRIWSRLGRVW
jgi:hypothetical protein